MPGDQVYPLDDVGLVAGVHVDVEEEGEAEFGGECEVGRRGGQACARDLVAHLESEVEVGRLEDLFVVHEFEVVSPDGVHELVVGAGWRFVGGRRGWLVFLLVEEHVGRVGLLEGEVEELVGCGAFGKAQAKP